MTDRQLVRQHLTVKVSARAGTTDPARSSSWHRDVTMGFLPHKGDMVQLWPESVDVPEQDWPVQLRRFDSDGAAHIELAVLSIEPDGPIHRSVQADLAELPWYHRQKGDYELGPELRRGGWQRT